MFSVLENFFNFWVEEVVRFGKYESGAKLLNFHKRPTFIYKIFLENHHFMMLTDANPLYSASQRQSDVANV